MDTSVASSEPAPAAPVVPNPWVAFTRGNGNAAPSAPAAGGSGWGALSTGSSGDRGATRSTGAEAKDSSNSGWAGLMAKSCRATQE